MTENYILVWADSIANALSSGKNPYYLLAGFFIFFLVGMFINALRKY